MIEFYKKLRSIIGKNAFFLLSALAIVGIFLIFGADGSASSDNSGDSVEKFDFSEYTSNLENRIIQIVSAIEGVDTVDVMLYFGDDGEVVYATEGTAYAGSGGTVSENYFVYSSAGGEKPLYIKRNFPKVLGAMLVCGGRVSESSKVQLIKSVSAMLGISATRVEVIIS